MPRFVMQNGSEMDKKKISWMMGEEAGFYEIQKNNI